MSTNSRRIFAVQEDLSTLNTALELFRDTSNNVLLTNCISRLLLGGKKFHLFTYNKRKVRNNTRCIKRVIRE